MMGELVMTRTVGMPKWDSISLPDYNKRVDRHQLPIPSLEIDKDQELVSEILSKESLASFSTEKLIYLKKLFSFILCAHEQGIPMPEIEGNYRDSFSFEWRSEFTDEFIVTLKPNGDLIYSGVFKTGTLCGVEKFDGSNIPNIITTSILRTI